MATTGITPSTNVSVTASTGQSGLAGIGGSDFMNILVKQLQTQDPFKPMTNSEMVQQLSTIRELEMNTRLAGKLEQLTDHQRFGSAAALIGKKVTGVVADGEGNEFKIEGVVAGISFTRNGDVLLELDTGDILPLAALRAVTNPDGSAVTTDAATKAEVKARLILPQTDTLGDMLKY